MESVKFIIVLFLNSMKNAILLTLNWIFNAPAGASLEEGESVKKGIELEKSSSDKYIDLLRPTARYCSMFKGTYFCFCSIDMG